MEFVDQGGVGSVLTIESGTLPEGLVLDSEARAIRSEALPGSTGRLVLAAAVLGAGVLAALAWAILA